MDTKNTNSQNDSALYRAAVRTGRVRFSESVENKPTHEEEKPVVVQTNVLGEIVEKEQPASAVPTIQPLAQQMGFPSISNIAEDLAADSAPQRKKGVSLFRQRLAKTAPPTNASMAEPARNVYRIGTTKTNVLISPDDAEIARAAGVSTMELSEISNTNERLLASMSQSELEEAMREVRSLFSDDTFSALLDKYKPKEQLVVPKAEIALEKPRSDQTAREIDARKKVPLPKDLSFIQTYEDLVEAANKYLSDAERVKIQWTGILRDDHDASTTESQRGNKDHSKKRVTFANGKQGREFQDFNDSSESDTSDANSDEEDATLSPSKKKSTGRTADEDECVIGLTPIREWGMGGNTFRGQLKGTDSLGNAPIPDAAQTLGPGSMSAISALLQSMKQELGNDPQARTENAFSTASLLANDTSSQVLFDLHRRLGLPVAPKTLSASSNGKPFNAGTSSESEAAAADRSLFLTRFDLEGRVVRQGSRIVTTTTSVFEGTNNSDESRAAIETDDSTVLAGLHHHDMSTSAAGYTFIELLGLSRSSVIGQRVLAFKAMSCILRHRKLAFDPYSRTFEAPATAKIHAPWRYLDTEYATESAVFRALLLPTIFPIFLCLGLSESATSSVMPHVLDCYIHWAVANPPAAEELPPLSATAFIPSFLQAQGLASLSDSLFAAPPARRPQPPMPLEGDWTRMGDGVVTYSQAKYLQGFLSSKTCPTFRTRNLSQHETVLRLDDQIKGAAKEKSPSGIPAARTASRAVAESAAALVSPWDVSINSFGLLERLAMLVQELAPNLNVFADPPIRSMAFLTLRKILTLFQAAANYSETAAIKIAEELKISVTTPHLAMDTKATRSTLSGKESPVNLLVWLINAIVYSLPSTLSVVKVISKNTLSIFGTEVQQSIYQQHLQCALDTMRLLVVLCQQSKSIAADLADPMGTGGGIGDYVRELVPHYDSNDDSNLPPIRGKVSFVSSRPSWASPVSLDALMRFLSIPLPPLLLWNGIPFTTEIDSPLKEDGLSTFIPVESMQVRWNLIWMTNSMTNELLKVFRSTALYGFACDRIALLLPMLIKAIASPVNPSTAQLRIPVHFWKNYCASDARATDSDVVIALESLLSKEGTSLIEHPDGKVLLLAPGSIVLLNSIVQVTNSLALRIVEEISLATQKARVKSDTGQPTNDVEKERNVMQPEEGEKKTVNEDERALKLIPNTSGIIQAWEHDIDAVQAHDAGILAHSVSKIMNLISHLLLPTVSAYGDVSNAFPNATGSSVKRNAFFKHHESTRLSHFALFASYLSLLSSYFSLPKGIDALPYKEEALKEALQAALAQPRSELFPVAETVVEVTEYTSFQPIDVINDRSSLGVHFGLSSLSLAFTTFLFPLFASNVPFRLLRTWEEEILHQSQSTFTPPSGLDAATRDFDVTSTLAHIPVPLRILFFVNVFRFFNTVSSTFPSGFQQLLSLTGECSCQRSSTSPISDPTAPTPRSDVLMHIAKRLSHIVTISLLGEDVGCTSSNSDKGEIQTAAAAPDLGILPYDSHPKYATQNNNIALLGITVLGWMVTHPTVASKSLSPEENPSQTIRQKFWDLSSEMEGKYELLYSRARETKSDVLLEFDAHIINGHINHYVFPFHAKIPKFLPMLLASSLGPGTEALFAFLLHKVILNPLVLASKAYLEQYSRVSGGNAKFSYSSMIQYLQSHFDKNPDEFGTLLRVQEIAYTAITSHLFGVGSAALANTAIHKSMQYLSYCMPQLIPESQCSDVLDLHPLPQIFISQRSIDKVNNNDGKDNRTDGDKAMIIGEDGEETDPEFEDENEHDAEGQDNKSKGSYMDVVKPFFYFPLGPGPTSNLTILRLDSLTLRPSSYLALGPGEVSLPDYILKAIIPLRVVENSYAEESNSSEVVAEILLARRVYLATSIQQEIFSQSVLPFPLRTALRYPINNFSFPPSLLTSQSLLSAAVSTVVIAHPSIASLMGERISQQLRASLVNTALQKGTTLYGGSVRTDEEDELVMKAISPAIYEHLLDVLIQCNALMDSPLASPSGPVGILLHTAHWLMILFHMGACINAPSMELGSPPHPFQLFHNSTHSLLRLLFDTSEVMQNASLSLSDASWTWTAMPTISLHSKGGNNAFLPLLEAIVTELNTHGLTDRGTVGATIITLMTQSPAVVNMEDHAFENGGHAIYFPEQLDTCRSERTKVLQNWKRLPRFESFSLPIFLSESRNPESSKPQYCLAHPLTTASILPPHPYNSPIPLPIEYEEIVNNRTDLLLQSQIQCQPLLEVIESLQQPISTLSHDAYYLARAMLPLSPYHPIVQNRINICRSHFSNLATITPMYSDALFGGIGPIFYSDSFTDNCVRGRSVLANIPSLFVHFLFVSSFLWSDIDSQYIKELAANDPQSFQRVQTSLDTPLQTFSLHENTLVSGDTPFSLSFAKKELLRRISQQNSLELLSCLVVAYPWRLDDAVNNHARIN